MSRATHQDKSHSDMRLRENREDSTNDEHEHLKKDGSPDHRYKENREDGQEISDQQGEHSTNKQHEHLKKDEEPDHRYKENREDGHESYDKQREDEASKMTEIPTKQDGTADMRYSESKEAVSSGLIQKDEVIEDALNGDDHQKKDGSKNKQYKENQQEEDEE